jgi:hypothetical protein
MQTKMAQRIEGVGRQRQPIRPLPSSTSRHDLGPGVGCGAGTAHAGEASEHRLIYDRSTWNCFWGSCTSYFSLAVAVASTLLKEKPRLSRVMSKTC